MPTIAAAMRVRGHEALFSAKGGQMKLTGASRRWCLSALLSVPMLASAGIMGLIDEDFEKKPWTEIEPQLPAFPEKENLIPFTVGHRTDMRYLIDGNSISVGSDGVLRYTMVVVSPSGAQSISYEGMRCDPGERRLYAFGRSDQTWSKARSNNWVKMRGSLNDPRIELFVNYFCAIGLTEITTPEAARRALRERGKPAAEH